MYSYIGRTYYCDDGLPSFHSEFRFEAEDDAQARAMMRGCFFRHGLNPNSAFYMVRRSRKKPIFALEYGSGAIVDNF